MKKISKKKKPFGHYNSGATQKNKTELGDFKLTYQDLWDTVPCATTENQSNNLSDDYEINRLANCQNQTLPKNSLENLPLFEPLDLSTKNENCDNSFKKIKIDEEELTSTSIIVEDVGDSSRRFNTQVFDSERSLALSNGDSQVAISSPSPTKLFSKNNSDIEINGLIFYQLFFNYFYF